MRFLDAPKGDAGERYPRRLYLALSALAVLSCLGLDFLASRRGEPAYLFPRRLSREAEPPAPVSLSELADRAFTEAGLTEKDIKADVDDQGQPRLSIVIPKATYPPLAERLQSMFRDQQADARVEEGEEDGRTTYSWDIRRGDREKLVLLISCIPPPQPGGVERPAPSPPAPSAATEKTVAIIIDDMGNSLETLQEILNLGLPVTISILPQSPYAVETAETARDHQLEVMLHLPGEPLNHQDAEALPPSFIHSGMTPEEIRSFVLDSLERVPYASGVNNHMGSKMTREKSLLTPVLDVLKERRLFFVDSRTGDGSIAYDLARKMGLRAGYRSVFLDSEVGVDYSRKKLIELLKLAKKKGRAIGIGHPFPETLRALKDNLSLLREYRIRLVPVSQIIPD